MSTASIYDYGHDLSCVFDLDAGMAEVDGRTALAQALARRLITPRGGLIDDGNYGFDVRQFINDDASTSDLARIASSIDSELSKDERVVTSTSTIALLLGVATVSSAIVDGVGPFQFVLAITNVTTAILTTVQS